MTKIGGQKKFTLYLAAINQPAGITRMQSLTSINKLAIIVFVAFTGHLLSAPNAHFGFVGTGGRAFAEKFNLPYYTLEGNYQSSTGTLFSSVNPVNDPAPGKQVVREVAKLNVRIDGLGESNAQFQAKVNAFSQALTTWYLSGSIGPKPTFTWYVPDVAALAAAEEIQITQTMDREKARIPAITGTVWEIGNEPNLFPSITPSEYAALFSKYYKIIKTKDPGAKVAFGSLFLREPAEDLQPRMEEAIQANLVAGGLIAGKPLYNAVYTDITTTLFSRIFATGTLEYLKACFAALDPGVQPDMISLHVYPYDDRSPTQSAAAIKTKIDSLISGIDTYLGTNSLHLPFWITEFGNINPALNTPVAVAGMASDLIDVFVANPNIQNWFYYKATGADQQFSLLPNSAPPLTRLALDSTFDPSNGDFPCGRLNAVGLMYYLRATGQVCEEKIGFEIPSSSATEAQIPLPIKVHLDRSAFDTVMVQYVLKGGTAQGGNIDFTLVDGTLKFLPGETEKTISLTLNDDAIQEGDETLVLALRNASHAGLSPDSLHFFTIKDNDNDLPFAPTGLSVIPAFKQIRVSWNRSGETDLFRYYLYQGTSPDTLVLVDSTILATDTNTLRTELKNGQPYYFKIRAIDSAQQSSPLSLIASSTPVNLPPTLKANPSDTAYEDLPFVYTASAVDVETTPVLSFKNFPSWLTIHKDSLMGTPHFPVADTSFTVIVSDGELTDSLTVTLVLKAANHKPQITALAVEKPEVAEGDSTLLQASAVDIDNDSMQYTWVLGLADTIGHGVQILFHPGYSSPQSVGITLVVRDAHGLAQDSVIAVKIINTPKPPLISGLPKIVTYQTSFNLEWQASGPDPDLDSTYLIEVGIFSDSGLTHILTHSDSMKVGIHFFKSFQGIHGVLSSTVWVAVRAKDAKNYQTGWSSALSISFEAEQTTSNGLAKWPQGYSLSVDWNGYGLNSPRITVLIPYGTGRAKSVTVRMLDLMGRNSLWRWHGNLLPGRHDFQPQSHSCGKEKWMKPVLVEMVAPGFRGVQKQ